MNKLGPKFGHIVTEETRNKISVAQIGRLHSEETKKKMSLALKGKPVSEATRIGLMKYINDSLNAGTYKCNFNNKGKFGPDHPKWIKDRTQVVGRHDRNFNDADSRHWRCVVKKRDGHKCRIDDIECAGRLEAHHILSWKDHPSLRYEVNNGITLCMFHHPRSREKEKMMSPYFQSLILEDITKNT